MLELTGARLLDLTVFAVVNYQGVYQTFFGAF